ncbi:hypothetical protein N7540_009011 [Penicillium herquei]|nr:hypothetical protein N7540_009011 [Penicillium herquei]
MLQIVFTVLVTKAVQMGVLGRHVEHIENPAAIPHALKLVYIGFVIINFGCLFAKTSFVITLLRIVTQPWQKATLWVILITVNTLVWLCALLAEAQCWPTYIFENIAMVTGAYSGCMDFILTFFPCLVVWNLQMKKREIIGIIIAMTMGVFATIAAFIKTSKLKNVAEITDFTCKPLEYPTLIPDPPIGIHEDLFKPIMLNISLRLLLTHPPLGLRRNRPDHLRLLYPRPSHLVHAYAIIPRGCRVSQKLQHHQEKSKHCS